jgi:hypothetical protein
MKLWITVSLDNLPHILQNGLDDPYSNEIRLSPNAELVADEAFSLKEELAVLEVEIPDDQLDEFLTNCVASHGDDLTDVEGGLEDALERGDTATVARIQKMFQAVKSGTISAAQMLDYFGYACLGQPLPPSMLKLLDPGTMLEALHSGNAEVVAHAIETTEATPFKSLNSAFWVWLMLLIQEIFGPGYGPPAREDVGAEEEDEAAERRLERMREAAAKKPRKKRTKKIPKK